MSKSRLLALQNKFQAHLLHAENAIQNEIVSTENVSTAIRLSVYSNAYRSRLYEALVSHYPALQIYLGGEQFEMLASDYIELNPSHYRSIRWFGDKVVDFLKDNEPYNDFPYLAELARVEWEMTLVFDAQDGNCIALDTLSRIPPEAWADMRFATHPSLRMTSLMWNVVPVWQALLVEESPEELLKSEEPVKWIFWRKDLDNYYNALSPDEACALEAVLQNATFGEVCEILCNWIAEEEVALRAASLMKAWIEAGLITEIHY
jgi:hypothetical protein